jgi:uncharacterized protein (DUF1684 family)
MAAGVLCRQVVLTVGIALAGACTRAPELPPVTEAQHDSAWSAWKAGRTAWLSIPGRPASYTGLHWLRQGPSTIGGDSANDIVLTGRGVPRRLGTLTREGNRVRFGPDADRSVSAVLVDSNPPPDGWLRTDADTSPSRIWAGSAGFRIIRRVDSLGVRMWDGDRVSPEVIARTMAPLDYFPRRIEWRLAARFEPATKPETLAVPTVTGVAEVYITVGTVHANAKGERLALRAFKGSNPRDLFFSFSDETSGEETYGFRFLHAALDTVTRAVTLDFNYAYNPDCAFSAFTTCPLPPQENRIGVRIDAGEKMVQHLEDVSFARRAVELDRRVKTGGD